MSQLEQLWEWVRGPLEGRPLLQAAVILAASLLAAKVVDWIITRGIKVWVRRTRTDLDDRLIAMLHVPIFVTVLIAGIGLASTRLDLEPSVQLTLWRVLKTLLTLLWLVFLARALGLVLKAVARLENRVPFIEPRTVALLDNSIKVLLIGGGIYVFCLIWRIPVAGWLATGGVLGLVIGLAAKDTLSNLFAGLFILADAPYVVGDFIVLDSGERGRVTDVGLRTTRLLTRDDVEVTVPNSVIANAKIVNESGGPWIKHRIRVRVGVAYGSDIDRVREVLLEVARAHPMVAEEPEPRVRFRAFGDSALELELLSWIDEPVLRGRALDHLYTEVYKRFQAEQIEIPYPKRDVYLHQAEATAGVATRSE